MKVIKRDGSVSDVHFDEITARIESLSFGLNRGYVKVHEVAIKVIKSMADNMTTTQLDRLTAEVCASLTTYHPDYGILAARIIVDDLHKSTPKSFSEAIEILYRNSDESTGKPAPMVSDSVYTVIMENRDVLDAAIQNELDFGYDYFGFVTLEKSYLMRSNGKIIERPQYLLMRVAIGIHGNDINAALETYTLMAGRLFTHATPTLFNAGTPKPQMSSCFLLTMQDDSIDGIYDTLKQCAKISQSAGGIGLAIHNVRAKGSYIRGTGGHSNGIVPMLRNFDMTARYVDQGGGKRKGSFAIYLEPWHADVYDFLQLKNNHGKEEMRARDLFYALWISDLFMQRVEDNAQWSLFCPNEAPGLSDVWGQDFERLYEKYEKEGKARKTVPARELWEAIIESQIENGTPYILYKDAANRKSNQKNLGTIKSSNLCTEIIEYTAPDEVAVCNLGSVALNMFVKITPEGNVFDHAHLHQITKVLTRNLNKVIDTNYYPVKEAEYSNFRHRPIGLGVQGLADAFMLMGLPFDSPEAQALNAEIFETMYHAAVETSMELAKVEGPYSTFAGSPASKGILQFDMWGVTPSSARYDWNSLKRDVVAHGLRNSLLMAPMPTASTSQILGNNECFEPYNSNCYTRRTLSGEFIVVNKHLNRVLIELGMWDEAMRQTIIAHKGSIANIPGIPQKVKDVFKTVWEISQKTIIDMSAARGAYICQSQSLNIHMGKVNHAKMSSMHFHAWKSGLKTGMYYLRTMAAADAISFTVDKTKVIEKTAQDEIACSLDNKEACMSCSG